MFRRFAIPVVSRAPNSSLSEAVASYRTFFDVTRGNGSLVAKGIVDQGHSMLGSSGSSLMKSQSAKPDFTNSSFFFQMRSFIQMRTVLKVADNSGAKKVMCIQSLAGKKGARLGDLIVVSVKEAMPNGKAKKGSVHHAVVVRAAMQRSRCDGSEIKFDDNACVLLDKKNHEPIGTRVFGPVPHELRKQKHIKILTLAKHIA